MKKSITLIITTAIFVSLTSCSKITNLFDRTHDDTKDYIEKELETEEHEEPNASDFQIKWDVKRMSTQSSKIRVYGVAAIISGSSNSRTKITDIAHGSLTCGEKSSYGDPEFIDGNYAQTYWSLYSPPLNNNRSSVLATMTITLNNGSKHAWTKLITY